MNYIKNTFFITVKARRNWENRRKKRTK